MDHAYLTPLILAIIATATPLLLAATGELVTEKSGVLNLGIEGMMLMGAVSGFVTAKLTGSMVLALVAAGLTGMAMSALFGFLALVLLANQVASGLALTIFGVGLSALVGANWVGQPIDPLPVLFPAALAELPLVGPVLFAHDFLTYLSFGAIAGVWWFLYRTKAGLILRAVGDAHDSAHAIGYNVVKVRFLATLFGGCMSGLAGAYLSLVYTPMWAENMSAGRGWIALALIVFATWRPGRVLIGAYLFGAIAILQLHAQGAGLDIPAQFLNMLPYLATILVLVIISRDAVRIRLNAPACIGKAFHPAA
ncbi:MAG: ABC transporter permease [Hyphomicrobiales bacterium]|nr:MAG: ABC transporter permease [Hyphomicrobiales bacterium]